MTIQDTTPEVKRAMEIAREKGHKVFTATHRATGATVYTVRSASEKDLFHILYIQAGRIVCDCFAAQHGTICSHAGAVRAFLIAQRDALASIEAQEAPAPSSCAAVEDMIAQHNEQERTESAQQEITDRLLASLTPEERAHREQMDAKMTIYGYTWNEAEYRYEYTETGEERNAKGQAAVDARLAADKAMYAEERQAEHDDAMELLDREGPDDEWEEVPAEEIAAIVQQMCALCGGMLVDGVCREGICARYGTKQQPMDTATAPTIHPDFQKKLDSLLPTDAEVRAAARERALPAWATDNTPFSIFKCAR